MPRTNTLVTFFVEKKMVYLLGKFGLFIGEIVLNNENLKHQKLFLFKLEKKNQNLQLQLVLPVQLIQIF